MPSNVNIVRLYQTAPPTERMVNATQENRIDPLDPLAVYRVMRICMAMGQAAGAAASIMTHTGDSTRTLDASRIRQHLKARGVQL